jgi:hypothetical protein
MLRVYNFRCTLRSQSEDQRHSARSRHADRTQRAIDDLDVSGAPAEQSREEIA